MTFDAGAIEARLILNRRDFQDELAAARAEGDAFDGKVFEAKAKLNTDDVSNALKQILAEWETLKANLDKPAKPEIDTGEIDAKIASTEAAFLALRDVLSQGIEVKANTDLAKQLNTPHEQSLIIDPSEALAVLQEVQLQYMKLRELIDADPSLKVNFAPFEAAITEAFRRIGDLKALLKSGLDLSIDDTKALAAIGDTLAAFKLLKASLESHIPLNVKPADAVSLPIGGGHGGTGADAMALFGFGGGGGGGGTGGAAGAAAGGVRAFGVALGGTIGLVGVWHIALDALVESFIAVSTASLVAAAGIGMLVPTAIAVTNHIQAVNDVNSTFADQIPVLGGGFRQVAESVSTASQAITIYGGVISLVKSQTGAFTSAGSEVVHMFNTWVAEIDIWVQKQGGFGGLLQTGISFLGQFAHIAAQVGVALDNLIKRDPGTAHFLLDIISAAAGLLDLVTKLPSPILTTALAMHSWYVWGGAAAGSLGRLPGPLGAIGKALQGVNHVQLGVFAALATGAFEMSRAWDTASANVVQDIAKTLNALNQLPVSQAIVQSTEDIGHFNQEIQNLNVSSVLSQWKSWDSVFQQLDVRWQNIGHDVKTIFSASSWGSFFSSVGNAFNLLVGNGDQAQLAMTQVQHDTEAYVRAINQAMGSQRNLFTVAGQLIQGTIGAGEATGNYTRALALMNLAGIQANDSLAVMQQKIANLISGYQAMSVQGNLLAGAVNAVTFQTEQQQSQVSKLTGAYSQWFTTISGGLSGFAAFGSDLAQLDQQLGMSASNLGTLSAQGYTLNPQLAVTASNAGKAGTALASLAAAGFSATSQFVTTANGAQTLFNNLLPLASAANLGQQGTNMLTQAMKDMMQILIPAAQQSSAMQTVLVAMAQEVDPNVTSFQQLTKWVGNTKDPMDNLDSIMQTLTKDAGNLTTDIQNLSTAMGTTLNAAMSQAILAATGGQQVFTGFAQAILTTKFNSNADQTASLALAESLAQLTGSTKNAHDEFVAFAENALHLTQTQAETLWKETLPGLQGFIDNMHGKNIDVNLSTSGSGDIVIVGTGIGTRTINTSSGQVRAVGGHTARGWLVSGGTPGVDSVPILAMPGELVVPTNIVSSGAVDHLRGMIPGFGAGGVVAPINGAINTMGTAEAQFGSAAAVAFAQAAVAAARSAAAAIGTAGVSNASAVAALQSAAAKRGWTGAEWTALNNVEMREAGYSLTATNPSSGAYGMAQFINGPSEYYQYGGNPNTYAGQAVAMVNYIAQRYGDPIAAWNHELNYGWYDLGGMLQPGWTLAYNGTGQPEPVGGNSNFGDILGVLQTIADRLQPWRPWWVPPPNNGSGGTTGSSGTPYGYLSGGNASAYNGFVGDYTGVVLPGSGGFGLTATQLGLPPQPQSSSSGTSTGGGGGSSGTGTSTGTGTGTPSPPKPKAAAPNKSKQAAIDVLDKLMGGYIWHNQLGEANQANSLLNWLGEGKYNAQLSEITQLDALLERYKKEKPTKKNAKSLKAAILSAEHLLASFGVHVFSPSYTAKGNTPKSDVIKKLESLMTGDIQNNDMTNADEDNSLLTSLGVSRFSGELREIKNLDSLLAKFKKAKNAGEIRAVETLLRQYGVRKYDTGGAWPNMTLGVNTSGRSETVVTGGGMDTLVSRLEDLVCVANAQLAASRSQPTQTATQLSQAIMSTPMRGAGMSRRYSNNR